MLTENEHLLSLSPVSECTFCDTDWLKERRSQLDQTEAVTFIHPAISNTLAEQLGVPSLVNRYDYATCYQGKEEEGTQPTLYYTGQYAILKSV